MAQQVTVQVPATTANCGSGFDCLGIALSYYNTFEFKILPEKKFRVIVQGEGQDVFAPDRSNLAIESLLQVFKKYRLPQPQGIALTMHNNIPLARGLGSSSSAIVAGVLAGDKLAGTKLSKQDILTLANEIEGHPDNVAPAIFGGVTLSYTHEGLAYSHRVNCPKVFKPVVVVPKLRLETKLARSVLPQQVTLADAIFNMSRAALFVNCLQNGHLELLSHALEDKLHQPYRAALIPHMHEVFAVAVQNGAYGAAISGAGSTLIAFCPPNAHHDVIGQAMRDIFTHNGLEAQYHVFDIDNQGAVII